MYKLALYTRAVIRKQHYRGLLVETDCTIQQIATMLPGCRLEIIDWKLAEVTECCADYYHVPIFKIKTTSPIHVSWLPDPLKKSDKSLLFMIICFNSNKTLGCTLNATQ